MTTEADPDDVRRAIEAEERDEPELEHIRIDHEDHPDQLALHDPDDTADAWMTAHGDGFIDLSEVR